MRVLISLIISLLLLYGCESASVRPDQDSVPVDTRAKMLFSEGDFELAASEYISLAEIHSDDSKFFRLKAAYAYIEADMFGEAEQLLEGLELLKSEHVLRFYQVVLEAKIQLASRQPDSALAILDIQIPEDAEKSMIIVMLETRAEALEIQDKFADAARERIRLGNYLTDADHIESNALKVWSLLLNISPEEMVNLRNSGVQSVGPWVELTAISRSLMSNKDQLNQALTAWSAANPVHPANSTITSQIILMSEKFDKEPGHIALLLPLTGIYERYSERIRDGFMSAWLAEAGYKPELRIYDANITNISTVYQTAVENGAEFIVGPLEKDAVRILAEFDTLPVRTLALNQIDYADMGPANEQRSQVISQLIQYGLPPEDEARQVAQRSFYEGYTKGLIITPADEFGERIYNAFSQEWVALGGNILEHVKYAPQTSDFITPVKALLNIDSSEARINMLRQQLGRTIAATSRVRQDPDFIFMVASNLTARQIVPHLRFFRSESIPIYTVSLVYAGNPAPQTDKDLNGVEFVDMPWLLQPESQLYSLHAQIQQGWESASRIFPRYYAFGIDAFRLISRLGELSLNQSYKYAGETGDLYMSDKGVIHRNLLWARFINGEPRRIDIGSVP